MDDVRSPIDLRDPATARQWADEADPKRPWRVELRRAIAARVIEAGARRVLELGSGPGLLAEHLLAGVADLAYTCLDFSPPMHELARARLGERATYVLADFKQPGWSRGLGTFDAVVTMQAVHELRHKRHALALYREVAPLAPLLVVCDHVPARPPRSRFTEAEVHALHATVDEQHAALRAAGFEPTTLVELHGLYVVAGVR